ncbi:MAG: hypothetical protein IMZ44_24790 [Planctomycetes bacterium]|nr:hypothetical protein [Planctomycetota bacterium]
MRKPGDVLPIPVRSIVALHLDGWGREHPHILPIAIGLLFGVLTELAVLHGCLSDLHESPFVSEGSEPPACGPGAGLAPPTADPPQPLDQASSQARSVGAHTAPSGPPVIRARQDGRLTIDDVLAAIRMEESRDGADTRDGDQGRAIGPYQIWHIYWRDARMPDGEYEDCRDEPYARRVVLSVWRRRAPEALAAVDPRPLARVHKGGAGGASDPRTLDYARRIERRLTGL